MYLMKRFLVSITPLALLLVLGVPAVALAQQNPILDIVVRVGEVVNALIPIFIAIALIYFVWGVTQYAISSSEETKSSGRDKMIWGAIGLFVIVSIWGIVGILQQFTGVAPQEDVTLPRVPGL